MCPIMGTAMDTWAAFLTHPPGPAWFRAGLSGSTASGHNQPVIVRVRTGQWQTQRQTLSLMFPNRCLKSFFLSRSEVQPQITTEVGVLGWGGVDG